MHAQTSRSQVKVRQCKKHGRALGFDFLKQSSRFGAGQRVRWLGTNIFDTIAVPSAWNTSCEVLFESFLLEFRFRVSLNP
jgi:hypothetical protein